MLLVALSGVLIRSSEAAVEKMLCVRYMFSLFMYGAKIKFCQAQCTSLDKGALKK